MVLLLLAQEDFADWISHPPGSMVFILLLSVVVAIISTLLTKLLVDTAALERKQKEIKAHQERKQEIIKLAEIDVKKYHKERKRWERRDSFIKKTQQGMAWQRMKPTCVTFLPMMIIFFFLNTTIYGRGPVAMPPMNPWDVPMLSGFVMANSGGEKLAWTKMLYGKAIAIEANHGWINFTAWYFICSLGINTLLQRLLGIQSQASGGMEGMFKGQQTAGAQFPEV